MDNSITPPADEHDKQARGNRGMAIISLTYLLLMLVLFLWLLFDTWVERYTVANLLGYEGAAALSTPLFRLVSYSFIGGALGGILNGIRSVIWWHSDQNVFEGRYIWKYVAQPWQGGTLALVAIALIASGTAVLGGEYNLDDASTRQSLAIFAVGVLAGYGSRDVSMWLDQQVTNLFRREEIDEDQSAEDHTSTIEEAESGDTADPSQAAGTGTDEAQGAVKTVETAAS